MASMEHLKQFDKAQFWRFFVDGRFHKKYDGWVKYEQREKGSALGSGVEYLPALCYTTPIQTVQKRSPPCPEDPE